MIYTPMTMKAMRLAYHAHHGQVDQTGMPYIYHPMHLAEQMEDEISCTVALLHDVAEDTEITLEQLALEFPPEVIGPLTLLTHQAGGDYFEYVRAIRQNPVAVKVKLADLDHNSDQSRTIGTDLPQEKLAYWRHKYDTARNILTEAE